ncbi:MAG: mannose-1-phosphate guanylyltransferase/mannose-6-phosphate isomerase [Candidatus Muproteobacteria bacterium RIFCSPHIGHO2_01_60_12]|nr:MAG: mannose-1-phosphate guanylyltransferase/mannose-6-phosphate isomerase [Candidatus Muproteobacteria bacterium RIFCSPHIGHO2_01_60_12]
MKINPVILSGGSGTRLWPLSREQYPKQLLCLLGEQTLLQQTVSRLDGMGNVAAPLLVCNEEHRFLIAEQLRQLGKTPADIILEPVGRNTAPALTLAALTLLKTAPDDELMLVMPADHVIQDNKKFHAAVREGIALAEKGQLVTFGIVPATPETGYGYIKKGDGNEVAAFVEKPDAETAGRYVASGNYLWNSGMFMMLASVWLDELNRFHPAMLEACKAAYEQGRRDGEFFRVNAQAFGSCQSNSIDYAVMEETDKAAVVALDAGWSDIGAWSSLWEASERDSQGNVVQGDVYAHATQNTLLISQHRFLAAVGLDDIIVIETPDAVLVAHKKHAQDVKEVVNRLKSDKRSEYQTHRRVYRPWGSYEGIDAGPRFQVKRLMVNPGAALSLQMHHHRAEHWIVVKGTARVTRGDEVFMLTENQSTYIPLGTTHRLENPGNIALEIIEVQSGSYLGEDDIVRFEDRYNRHQ